MGTLVDDLVAQGLTLAPEDRSRLVDLLLESLHEQPLAEVQSAWDDEARRRLAAVDRGGLPVFDGEDVLAEARRRAS